MKIVAKSCLASVMLVGVFIAQAGNQWCGSESTQETIMGAIFDCPKPTCVEGNTTCSISSTKKVNVTCTSANGGIDVHSYYECSDGYGG
jgi:hypothetical protein